MTTEQAARNHSGRGAVVPPPAQFQITPTTGHLSATNNSRTPLKLHEFAAQTGEEGFQDVAPKLVINKFAGTPDGNQAGDFQLFHVMRKRWRSDFEASPHGFAGQWLSGAADPLD